MRIGVLWKKEKDGKKYMTGIIENPLFPDGKIHIAIFPNGDDNRSEKSPDCHIVWSSNNQSNNNNNTMSDDDIPM